MVNKEITSVKETYESWRRKNGRDTPIELREQVLGLCKKYGENVVSREVGVSTSSLWRWHRAIVGNRKREKRVRRMKFVEVGTPLESKLRILNSKQIEWRRSDGSQLSVLGEFAIEELAVLASRFLWEGRVEQ